MDDLAADAPAPASIPDVYSRFRLGLFRIRQALNWCIHTRLARLAAYALIQIGSFLNAVGIRPSGLKIIFFARRIAPVPGGDRAIRKVMEEDAVDRNPLDRLLESPHPRSLLACAPRILILKVPCLQNGQVVEKGALIIKFTETFAPFFLGIDTNQLADHFWIILEPSRVGYSVPELVLWTRLDKKKVIVLTPCPPDHQLLEAMNSNLVPLPLGPADWTNPTTFRKLASTTKKYDAIYVANFKANKRVDRYIRAVVHVGARRPGYRAALVCASWGEEECGNEIRQQVAWAKRKVDLDFFFSVNRLQLAQLFNASKVNVLVSLREGANKGLAEGLFAGTPALLMAENLGGNYRHINAQTGRVVADRHLEKALEWFADHYTRFRPEIWAQNNISPLESTARLSAKLEELGLEQRQRWTRELLVKVNQPELQYMDPENDWLLDERAALLDCYAPGARSTSRWSYLERLEAGSRGQRASFGRSG
jgi:glycosyltransferase involved in cell wall biosynthesis